MGTTKIKEPNQNEHQVSLQLIQEDTRNINLKPPERVARVRASIEEAASLCAGTQKILSR